MANSNNRLNEPYPDGIPPENYIGQFNPGPPVEPQPSVGKLVEPPLYSNQKPLNG
jgi:hypothetical protein